MATAKKMSQGFIKTGVPGLDEIFYGGFRTQNVVLIEGCPGTGKTTMGLQFIYFGAKEYKQNGLIISFELSQERVLEDARGFGWELDGLKRKKGMVKVIHMNPSAVLQDFLSPNSKIVEVIKTFNIKRVLIDGLTPLKTFSEMGQGPSFRNNLYLLIQTLHRLGIVTVLTRELPDNLQQTMGQPDEQFLCDTIITLSQTTNQRNVHRCLEVKKSRGQRYIQGLHTLRIEEKAGLCVYRRTQSIPKDLGQQPTSSQRVSTGIKTLDPIIGGGIYKGSLTLVVGVSGAGKTVMGMQFLHEGVRMGQRGLMISLDEHPKQLIRNAKTLGIGLETHFANRGLHVICESPLELEMDVHFHRIIKLIEEEKIERVVVDSVIAYQNANNAEAQQFIYALANYLKNKLITSYFHYESPELLGLSQISEDLKASSVVDNIILLNYVEISTQMRRAITVPKSRGTLIPQITREFIIEEGGIRLLNDRRADIEEVPQLPFSSYYGILSRAPARQSPLIEERIMRGGGLPESAPIN